MTQSPSQSLYVRDISHETAAFGANCVWYSLKLDPYCRRQKCMVQGVYIFWKCMVYGRQRTLFLRYSRTFCRMYCPHNFLIDWWSPRRHTLGIQANPHTLYYIDNGEVCVRQRAIRACDVGGGGLDPWSPEMMLVRDFCWGDVLWSLGGPSVLINIIPSTSPISLLPANKPCTNKHK